MNCVDYSLVYVYVGYNNSLFDDFWGRDWVKVSRVCNESNVFNYINLVFVEGIDVLCKIFLYL